MIRSRLVLLCLPILGSAACLDNADTPSVTVWETELAAELTHPDVGGQAAAVSEPAGTSLGILVTGSEPGAAHAWGLRVGSCADPGAQVGPSSDYPELAIGATGSGEAETHLGSRLSSDQSYHVEVRVSATDGSRVACGDLIPR